MSIWKRLLSYLLPIKEHELESPISGPLEICWENGHLALNSGQANYSYNHLEQVFKGAMNKAGLAHRQVDRVLNLGMGAGSTVKLLRKDFGKDPYIRSIEMDPLIIELAERYFSIGEDGKHEILCTEALSYVQECTDTFDLILVDLFIDNEVTPNVLTMGFIMRLIHLLTAGGVLILNTLPHPASESFKAELKANGFSPRLHLSRDNKVFLFLKD